MHKQPIAEKTFPEWIIIQKANNLIFVAYIVF